MFSFGSKSFLGIDIGNYSIRLIELEKKGKSFNLKNYAEHINLPTKEQPFGCFEKDSFSLLTKEVAKTIKSLYQQAGFKVKKANFAIPDFYTFFVSIDLPKMDKDEITQAIEYEIRPYIPVPIKDVTLDWNIVEGTPGKTSLKILVAAIPNSIINQYKKIAKLANLKINFLEPEVFALNRIIKKESAERIISLIDMGIKSTTCNIMENQLVKLSHSFNTGGNEITKTLARGLNISYNEAEQRKKEKGLLDPEIKKVLFTTADSIVDEIKKVFRNYYTKSGQDVKKIILSGGSSEMPGLKEYLSEKLEKEVEFINTFSNVSYPDILKDDLKKRSSFYAVALGAALKGLK